MISVLTSSGSHIANIGTSIEEAISLLGSVDNDNLALCEVCIVSMIIHNCKLGQVDSAMNRFLNRGR
jgi:HD-like signal output (HDOD) protein